MHRSAMVSGQANAVPPAAQVTRRLLAAWVAGAALLATSPAWAQAWPAKPIRLIVPFVAGGGADATARMIAAKMQERLGQHIIIDNKPGGNTIIGVNELLKAQPDGYTLLWTIDQTFVLNPSLYNALPYDPKTSFTPVGVAITSPISVIARAQAGDPVSVHDMVRKAKASPGTLNVGSAAILAHIAFAEFSQSAGIDAARITYKGSAQVAQAVMGGDIHAAFDGLAPYAQFVQAGRARILAVTSARRFSGMPDVPTLDELGYKGVDFSVWFGMAGPAGMAPAIARRVADEAAWAVRQPDIAQKLGNFGFEAAPDNGPASMAERISVDMVRYAPVIKNLGFKLD